MKTTVHILIPFDLGLELDFEGADAKAIAKEISSRPIENLMFGGRAFTDVRLTVQIYKFGVGQLGLTFDTEGDLDVLATLSCRAEALTVGARSITEWAHSLVDEVIAGAKRFASHAYDRRLEDVDPFPVFVFEKGAVKTRPNSSPKPKSVDGHRVRGTQLRRPLRFRVGTGKTAQLRLLRK
jgi:hypothetical protein